MASLKDKVVVITGAGIGIGRATANPFAREHAKLVLCDKDELGLHEVAGAFSKRTRR